MSAIMKFSFRIWCVVAGVVSSVHGAAKCPAGGQYFDKHLGQSGRMACCSELCQASIFQEQCRQKCPNYHTDKARAADIVMTDPKAGSVLDSSSRPDSTRILLYILPVIAAAVISLGIFLMVRIRRGERLLPRACSIRVNQIRNRLLGTAAAEDRPAEQENTGLGQNRNDLPTHRQAGDAELRQHLLMDPSQPQGVLHADGGHLMNGELPSSPLGNDGLLSSPLINGRVSTSPIHQTFLANGGLPSSPRHPSCLSSSPARPGPASGSEYQTAEHYRAPIQAQQDSTGTEEMAIHQTP